MHGVRYTQFIGDGDSSVYPTLIQNIPEWGHAIKKVECANHSCKCYQGALEKLVQEHPSYKGSGGLTQKMRKRLVSAARSAIRMRSKESDKKTALKSLQHDLQNGPRHCFDFHNHCSPDFCKTARERPSSSGDMPTSSSGPLSSATSSSGPLSLLTSSSGPLSSAPHEDSTPDDNEDDLEGLFTPNKLVVHMYTRQYSTHGLNTMHYTGVASEQATFWEETLDEDPATETNMDPRLYHDIQVIVSRLHIRSKFDEGKVINRSQSGSWEHRRTGGWA